MMRISVVILAACVACAPPPPPPPSLDAAKIAVLHLATVVERASGVATRMYTVNDGAPVSFDSAARAIMELAKPTQCRADTTGAIIGITCGLARNLDPDIQRHFQANLDSTLSDFGSTLVSVATRGGDTLRVGTAAVMEYVRSYSVGGWIAIQDLDSAMHKLSRPVVVLGGRTNITVQGL